MNGLLLVDKKKGWTSFDVVNYVRGMIATSEKKKPKQVKVGHTGTLDPSATGLLILCVGLYTKKSQELMKKDKVYEVEMTLGQISTTGDIEGDLTQISSIVPSKRQLQQSLNKFLGDSQQVPPSYSAIKVNGERAYKLARDGQKVVLHPRDIHIFSLKLEAYEYPKVYFKVGVSSGTYIRSLAEDIGKDLGTGAFMSNLRRTKNGIYSVKNAIDVKNLSGEIIQNYLLKTD